MELDSYGLTRSLPLPVLTRSKNDSGLLRQSSLLISNMSRIGLINEKPLHASLKQWYARPGDRFEVPVDGFVIDIVRDNLLIEIQTRNFAAWAGH